MPCLLLVDDEPNVLFSLGEALATDELEVITAKTARAGLGLVRERRPDAVVLDVRLPDQSGLDVFDEMRRLDPRLPVVIITAHATTETAIEAMKRGAFDYLLKPLDLRQLRAVVSRALEQSRVAHVPAVIDGTEAEADPRADRIVGRSAAMQEVYKAIGRVAPQDVTVLITGESGTGKELVARAIIRHSRRAEGPFLAINCAAIPEALIESELFGHERGAFSGADRRRIGKFEQAHGGTIFLDEVGDMPAAAQAKMLRLLQEGTFERLGGNETIRADVRIIAATNRDLEAAGSFRQDLLYRLKVYTIHLPPLRERPEDLPLLVDHAIQRLNRELGRRVRSVSPEAMSLLGAHQWPGNVRELQAALKYALIQAPGEVLTPECLPEGIRPPAHPACMTPAPEGLEVCDLTGHIRGLIRAGETDLYAKVTSLVDRVLLTEVLRHTGGSQVQASELLGIARGTLRAKLRAAGLTVEKQVGADPEQPGQ